MVNAQPSSVAISPRAAANLKRSLVLAIPVGLAFFLLLALIGHPLAGLFVMVGLGLGFGNVWAVQRAVVSYGQSASKGAFLRSVFGRLGALTVLGLVPAFFLRPDGFGVIGGIAIFQAMMVAGSIVSMSRELRRS
ncbi:MAG: hypothetical protein WCA46_24240 [Actinocatenispora sp.]